MEKEVKRLKNPDVKKEIYEFAQKYYLLYRSDKTKEFEVDNGFAEECTRLGFKMDCGESFKSAFPDVNPFEDADAFKRALRQTNDEILIGSAIFSIWRSVTHWSYGHLLDDENRELFIPAFARLIELTFMPDENAPRMSKEEIKRRLSMRADEYHAFIDDDDEHICEVDNNVENKDETTIIVFPEFVTLKAEVEKLRTEISMLLLERDELRLVICKNIETAYMLALGSLEYKAFELHCEFLRLKRKIDLVQAKKNRQEKVVISAIEKILDEEFEEYQRQLDEQINKMNKALDHSKGRPLTEEETKEVKKVYRNIVKALHPDLHPDITPAQIQLFQNAVQAYENGDLNSLRIISEMVAEPVIPEKSENGLTILAKEKERLSKTIELIREQITEIKSEYPYTMKDLVDDPEQIAKKKAELEETIKELKEAYDIYAARLKEMLR